MDRFSSIDQINRRYRDSQGFIRGSAVGGFPSSYVPPRFSIPGNAVPGLYPTSTTYHQNRQTIEVSPTPTVMTATATPYPNEMTVTTSPIHNSSNQVIMTTPRGRRDGCPWWVWLLVGILGLLLLIGLTVGLWYAFKNKGRRNVPSTDSNSEQNNSMTNRDQTEDVKNGENNSSPQGQIDPQKDRSADLSQEPTQPVEGKNLPDSQSSNDGSDAQGQNSNQNDKDQKPDQDAQSLNQGQAKPNSEQSDQQSPQDSESAGGSNSQQSKSDQQAPNAIACQTGYFQYLGKCISCPKSSIWNGTNCIVKQPKTQFVSSNSETTVQGDISRQNKVVSGSAKSDSGQINDSDKANDSDASSSNSNTANEDTTKPTPTQIRTTTTTIESNSTKQTSGGQGANSQNGQDSTEAKNSSVPQEVNAQTPQSSNRTTGKSSSLWDEANNLGQSVDSSTGGAVSGIASGVSSLANSTGNAASSLWQGTKEIASSTWKQLSNLGADDASKHQLRKFDN